MCLSERLVMVGPSLWVSVSGFSFAMSEVCPQPSDLSLPCVTENTPEVYRELLENEKKNFQLVRSAVRDLGGVPAMLHHADMSNTIPDEKVRGQPARWCLRRRPGLLCVALLSRVLFPVGGYHLPVISLCEALGSPQRNQSGSAHPDGVEKVQTEVRPETPSGMPEKGKRG